MRAANIKPQLVREVRTLLAAWQHGTSIPLPPKLLKSLAGPAIPLQQSARYAPLIGIVVGSIAGGIYAATMAIAHDKALAVILAIAASVLVTGAKNEDGIARFFEAFCATSRSKYDVLKALNERALGAIGVTTLVFSIFIKYAALQHIPVKHLVVALIVAHAFSRFAALSFVFTSVRADGASGQDVQPAAHPGAFILMAAFGMLPLLLVDNLLFLLLVPFLWVIRALIGVWFTQKVGGWTTQSLSGVLVLTETATYFILAIALQYAFTNF